MSRRAIEARFGGFVLLIIVIVAVLALLGVLAAAASLVRAIDFGDIVKGAGFRHVAKEQ